MAGKVTSFNVQGEDYRVEANLQFDSTPTQGSTNPVTSNGIYDAIRASSIGDDVSIGRVAGSTVGYRSVVYGVDSVATGSYSIVFGYSNKSISNGGSFMSGYNNMEYGYGQNITIGQTNTTKASYSVTLGHGNVNGIGIRDISAADERRTVYCGYVVTETKKIYTSNSLEVELDVYQDQTGSTVYFIDCTNASGDVYIVEYSWDSRAQKYVRKPFVKITNWNYVDITNVTHSISYDYSGVAYYNRSNGNLYADSAQTQLVNTGYLTKIYLDINNSELIRRTPTSGRTWSFFKPVIGYNANNTTGNGEYIGRYAYIDDVTHHVYSSSDKETDITSNLYDGEVVVSLFGGKAYQYFLDTNQTLIGTYDVVSNSSCTSSIVVGENNMISTPNVFSLSSYGCAIFGKGNKLQSGLGDLVAGRYNNVVSPSPYAGANCVAGVNNKIYNFGGNGSGYIFGYQNFISTYSDEITHPVVFGDSNTIDGYDPAGSVVGGKVNICFSIPASFVMGNTNRVCGIDSSSIIGADNSINEYVNTDNSTGVTEKIISNVTPSHLDNDTDSYETNTLYRVYGRKTGGYIRDEEVFINYAYSQDGVTLINVDNSVSNARNDKLLYVYGSANKVVGSFASYINTGDFASLKNTIIGHDNYMVMSSKTAGVTLVGRGLRYQGNSSSVKTNTPSTILGSFNVDSGDYINGVACKFLVGIGTADNNRKNGLAVLGSGVVLAPESPNSISSASAASGNTAEKMLVTYAMLQDYAPKTPGAIGKPAQTIITLEAGSWSNMYQDATIPDMTTSAVVLIEPSGDPDAYYIDRVYMSSQNSGSLTFSCQTTPSVDINVKVVYWP